jgi:hypothetical protein
MQMHVPVSVPAGTKLTLAWESDAQGYTPGPGADIELTVSS